MKIKEEYKVGYDIFMGILALFVVGILVIEMTQTISVQISKIFSIVDNCIWVVFCLDYFVRFGFSKEKISFIKNNIIDLLSIIPFNSMFKVLRTVKLFKVGKLMRLIKLSKGVKALVLMEKFKDRFKSFLKTNNFIYVLYITVVTILFGAIGISFVEKLPFDNALWWSFVTTTTVGYGDISPATNIGRIIAVILMVVGIGFVGMLTGTIATYFLGNSNDKKLSYKDGIIEDAKSKLDDFDNLSKEELQDIFKVLLGLKN
ncbi:ion channel [Clostridium paraputrificum]|uniref:potassium channel family protein n=1 Tax=Clostridium paraputrificum TaxID=29363 RepID=UPI00325AF71F